MAEEPRELLEYKTDHDLLIALNVHMENLRTDLRDLKDGNAKRLEDVEGDAKGMQRDISGLQASRGYLYGAIAVLAAIVLPAVGWLFADYIQFKTSNDSHINKVITNTVQTAALINH